MNYSLRVIRRSFKYIDAESFRHYIRRTLDYPWNTVCSHGTQHYRKKKVWESLKESCQISATAEKPHLWGETTGPCPVLPTKKTSERSFNQSIQIAKRIGRCKKSEILQTERRSSSIGLGTGGGWAPSVFWVGGLEYPWAPPKSCTLIKVRLKKGLKLCKFTPPNTNFS